MTLIKLLVPCLALLGLLAGSACAPDYCARAKDYCLTCGGTGQECGLEYDACVANAIKCSADDDAKLAAYMDCVEPLECTDLSGVAGCATSELAGLSADCTAGMSQ